MTTHYSYQEGFSKNYMNMTINAYSTTNYLTKQTKTTHYNFQKWVLKKLHEHDKLTCTLQLII